MKAIDLITYDDEGVSTKTFFPTISQFCKHIGIHQSTFTNMIGRSNAKLSKCTQQLSGKIIIVYDDENIEEAKRTYDFVQKPYIQKDYNEKMTCECGGTTLKREYKRHCLSKKHTLWINHTQQ